MNKNSFATLLLTLLLCMMSTDTFAYDFEVGGIYYNLIDGKAAEVTYKGPRSDTGQSYSGEVVIPEKVTYKGVEYPVDGIGYFAFYDCSNLTSITLPNSVTSIGGSAFEGCTGLTSITIPNSVTSIGGSAFHGCTGLTSITIPNSVTSIGIQTFYGCSSLTTITIPNSVTSIGGAAFAYCSALTSITIPNSVTSIGGVAFYYCTGLTTITIPNSVTSIEGNAFRYCSFTSIKVDADNNKYDSRDNCNAIIETRTNTLITGCKNTIIPNSVTSIGGSAFEGCTGLTSITLPNSVTSIGDYAFMFASLTSITLPNSVTSIEDYAYSGCSKLEEVNCYAEKVPSTNTDAFKDSYPQNATLYVPASAINDYKTTAPWSEFGTIKAIGGGETQKWPLLPSAMLTRN